jgi:hypothetical protein
MKNKLSFLAPIIIVVLSLTFACKPDPKNEEELITTLKLSFTNGGSTQVFEFKDIDGIGGGADGITDTIVLDSNKVYVMTVSVLNESETPSEDITSEIRNESSDHQFFYNVSSGLNLTHTYNDTDANGLPIGLSNTISSGNISNGTLRVNLKHQPEIKDGNQNTGESDIDVTFVVYIK